MLSIEIVYMTFIRLLVLILYIFESFQKYKVLKKFSIVIILEAEKKYYPV